MSAGIDECSMIQHVVQVSKVSSEASVSNQPGNQISCCLPVGPCGGSMCRPGKDSLGRVLMGVVELQREGQPDSDSIGMIGS